MINFLSCTVSPSKQWLSCLKLKLEPKLAITLIFTLLCSLLMSGCASIDEQQKTGSVQSAEQANSQVDINAVNPADISTAPLNSAPPLSSEQSNSLIEAKNAQDYRLLITTTRGFNAPGILAKDIDTAIVKCGTKYQPGTGDVIRSEQERTARKTLITFMAYYNQQMWASCVKQE